MHYMSEPFDIPFSALPSTIPVFPLHGVLLVPEGKLPLNIFEPRYLNMVFDALALNRMIGIIQPDRSIPTPPPSLLGQQPEPIYTVGCAGRITNFAESEDGRLLITLLGVCRFTVKREIATIRGYRRVETDWNRFSNDMSSRDKSSLNLDRIRLLTALRDFFKHHNIQVDWQRVEKMSDAALINFMAMNLPFEPGEKQALLEASNLEARAVLMTELAEMFTAGNAGNAGGNKSTRH
jgi:uncharacterized protein